jgi:hypothetical protein
MADRLATPEGLRLLLKEDTDGLSDDTAMFLVELATGAVQAAAGQVLVEVPDDVVTLIGDTDSWFNLPQRPVTTVTTVKIDGTTVTDYKRFGARLWRTAGWATCSSEPSAVEVTYSHGYPEWDRGLSLATGATLALAAKVYENPVGAIGMSIDDYRLQFGQSQASELAVLIPDNLRKSLRRAYGARGGLVRLG